ncbi:crotonase/enoyl-CoA hydratase family protein [Rhizobium sp. YIM 134829]|uniref:crotonase/enoyl-CoA hydratase family protein n=1 Tax=Rhizobium sp. YIM 134829 TaxID=3390453 RepID=UPI00397E2B1B
MTDEITIDHPSDHPGVRVLRFNRPQKKNALTQAMYRSLNAALDEAEASDAVRAIVFLGSEGCFCAGNDLADFATMATGSAVGGETLGFLRRLVEGSKPLLSGVDGLAVGIGTTLTLHCDLTVASERALFKTPFVDLGLVPEAGSSLLLPRLIGHQRAFALLCAGLSMSATEALQSGLIARLVPAEVLERETLALAALLASKPPEALRLSRQLLRGDPDKLSARIDEEAALFASRLQSPEAQAAFAAFLNR